MIRPSSKLRRRSEPRPSRTLLLFLLINAVGLPLAIIIEDTPSTVWGWLGALFLESVFLIAIVGWSSSRRD